MMGISGFKTKKELKAALGEVARFIETSFFGAEFKGAGHTAWSGLTLSSGCGTRR